VDENEIDAGWAPPIGPDRSQDDVVDPPARRRRPRILTVGIPVLAVVVIIAAVWALGGFDRRRDQVQDVATGSPVVQGPLTLTFTRATVQEANGYGQYKRIQKIVAYGTARNTWTESFDPQSDWFIARDPNSDLVETGQLFKIVRGDDVIFDAPDTLAPGLPAQPVSVEFEMPPTFKPGRSFVFGVAKVDFGNHSFFTSSDEETWDDSGTAYRMRLPLQVLKPEPTY
jgi:hypothetical protein